MKQFGSHLTGFHEVWSNIFMMFDFEYFHEVLCSNIFMKFDVRVCSWSSMFEYFHEVRCSSIFRKPVEKTASLKLDKNNRYFTWRPIYIFTTSRSFLLSMRTVSDKSCRENENYILYLVTLFCSGKLSSLWDNVEKYGRQKSHRWQYNTAHAHCVLDN